jgi:hypothetical protein
MVQTSRRFGAAVRTSRNLALRCVVFRRVIHVVFATKDDATRRRLTRFDSRWGRWFAGGIPPAISPQREYLPGLSLRPSGSARWGRWFAGGIPPAISPQREYLPGLSLRPSGSARAGVSSRGYIGPEGSRSGTARSDAGARRVVEWLPVTVQALRIRFDGDETIAARAIRETGGAARFGARRAELCGETHGVELAPHLALPRRARLQRLLIRGRARARRARHAAADALGIVAIPL